MSESNRMIRGSENDPLLEGEDQDSDSEKSPSCCNTTGIRRGLRIAMLLVVIILSVLIPVLSIKSMHTYDKFYIDLDRPMEFIFTNCKLYISEDHSLDRKRGYMVVDLPGVNYNIDESDKTKRTIEVHNGVNYTDTCLVDLQTHPKASIPGLTFNCTGTCYVSQMGPHPLNLIDHDLVINGDTVDLMAVRVVARKVIANVTKGSLHIYDLNLASDETASSMWTGEGDLVVQSVKPIKVHLSQADKYMCMYAPKMVPLEGFLEDREVYFDDQTPSNCSKGYLLCGYDDVCTNSTAAPSVALEAINGNVYANVITKEGAPVEDSFEKVYSPEYTKGLNFNEDVNRGITEYIDGFNESVEADPLIWLALGPTRVFSTSTTIFLLATNDVYFNLRPWWMHFLTAGLLVGDVYRIETNLLPGVCPFITLPTTRNLYLIRSFLVSRFTLFSTKADAAFLYSPTHPAISSALQPNLGFKGIASSLELYNVAFNGTHEVLEEYNLARSISMLLAVVISCILSLGIGIVVFFVLLKALHEAAYYFTKRDKHLRKYLKKANKGEHQSSSNEDNAREAPKKSKGWRKYFGIMSLYALIDDLMNEFRKMFDTSSYRFCSALFRKGTEEEIKNYQPIPAKQLRLVYEKYCFLNRLPEEDLANEENKKKFLDKGYSFGKLSNDAGAKEEEILIKIRWLRANEKPKQLKIMDNNDPNASINAFLEYSCAFTAFETDRIKLEDFRERYKKFCDENQLESIDLTRETLHYGSGIESILVSPEHLIKARKDTKHVPDLEYVKKLNDELVSLSSSKSKNQNSEVMVKARSYSDYVFDFFAVVLHLLCLLVIGAMPIILPLMVELEVGKYAIGDYRCNLKYDDFKYTPWRIIKKMQYFSTWSLIIIGIAAGYIIIEIYVLIAYYIRMPFFFKAVKNDKEAKPSRTRKNVMKVIGLIEWIYVTAVMAVISMYISMVSVWFVLGTVLNPDRYLAYGAAAITLAGFILTKTSEFKDLNRQGHKALYERIFNKFKMSLNDVMKKMLARAGFSSEATSSLISGEGTMLERAQKLITGSPVGKAISSIGIDPKSVVGLLSGDQEAIVAIGVNYGVPEDVMNLLLAVVKGENENIIRYLQELAGIPQLQIDPGIVHLLIELITNVENRNTPVLIANLAKIFGKIHIKYQTKDEKSVTDPNALFWLDICTQLVPQLICAFQYFTEEDIEIFLDQYEIVNDCLYNFMKTGIIKFADPKKDEHGEESKEKEGKKSVLPTYAIKTLKLINLLVSKKKSSTYKMKKLILNIMNKLFKLDQKVMDILNLLLESQPDTLTEIDEKDGLVTLEEQQKVLVDMGDILKIPPVLLRFAWAEWTGNYIVDDKFVEEVCTFAIEYSQPKKEGPKSGDIEENKSGDIEEKKSGDIEDSKSGDTEDNKSVNIEDSKPTIKLALQLYNLGHVKVSPRSIIKGAEKFSIEPSIGSIAHLFGEARLSQENYDALSSNHFFQDIAEGHRISIDHLLGCVALLKGDFGSSQIHILIDKFIDKRLKGFFDECSKLLPDKLPKGPSQFEDFRKDLSNMIIGILRLFLGEDENDVIASTKRLGLKPVEFALTSRHLLHPRNISGLVLDYFRIDKNNSSVMSRMHIPADNFVLWDKWIVCIKELLSKNLPVKSSDRRSFPNQLEEEEKQVDESFLEPNQTIQTTSRLYNTISRAHDNEERKDPSILKILPAGEDEKKEKNKQDKGKELDQASAKDLLSLNDITTAKKIIEKAIKNIISKFVTRNPCSEDKCETLRGNLYDSLYDDMYLLVWALKSIKENKMKKQQKSAIDSLSFFINTKPALLNAILSLIYPKTKEKVIEAIEVLLKKNMSKYEPEQIKKYSTFILNKYEVLKNTEQSLVSVANQLKIPKPLIEPVFCSSLNSRITQRYTMNEFMEFLDQKSVQSNELSYDPEVVKKLWFILSGIVTGNNDMVLEFLEQLAVPKEVKDLAHAMIAENQLEKMEGISELVHNTLKKGDMAYKSALDTLLNLCKWLYGLYPQTVASSKDYKSSKYGTLEEELKFKPEVLTWLEAMRKNDKQKLIKTLPGFIEKPPHLPAEKKDYINSVKCLTTVLMGDNMELKDLAEKVGVRQEVIKFCFRLININKAGEEETNNHVSNAQYFASLPQAWDAYEGILEQVNSLLALTFKTYNLESVDQLLHNFSIFRNVDTSLAQPLLAIANSWCSLQSSPNVPLYRTNPKRVKYVKDLETYLTPVCKQLLIDPCLALIAVRIRQGDFYIIEDKKKYLSTLLPSDNIRKLAMGVCGTLTLPITFDRGVGESSRQGEYALTFEGACEMLCELLGINPAIPRVVLLEDKILDSIEKDLGIPKEVVIYLLRNYE